MKRNDKSIVVEKIMEDIKMLTYGFGAKGKGFIEIENTFSNILKQINSTKENSIRFWKFIGFIPNGKDEYDMSLFIKKAGLY